VNETLHLLERVVARSSQALLDAGGASLIARLFMCSKKRTIVAVSTRVRTQCVVRVRAALQLPPPSPVNCHLRTHSPNAVVSLA
jgi:hypothetical protein